LVWSRHIVPTGVGEICHELGDKLSSRMSTEC